MQCFQHADAPAVEGVASSGDQAHGKFVLEHDDGCSEGGAVRQELKGEGRGDLIGDVGHAHIKIWQLCLQHVTLDDLHGT